MVRPEPVRTWGCVGGGCASAITGAVEVQSATLGRGPWGLGHDGITPRAGGAKRSPALRGIRSTSEWAEDGVLGLWQHPRVIQGVMQAAALLALHRRTNHQLGHLGQVAQFDQVAADFVVAVELDVMRLNPMDTGVSADDHQSTLPNWDKPVTNCPRQAIPLSPVWSLLPSPSPSRHR